MLTKLTPTLSIPYFNHRAILSSHCHCCNFLWFVCQPELKEYLKFLCTFNVTGEYISCILAEFSFSKDTLVP